MIDYSISENENILYCNISGKVKLIDFTNYVAVLVADEGFDPKLNAIIQISENTEISYASEAVSIGQFFTHFLQQRKGVAWAFVSPHNTTKGLASLFVAEIDSSSITVNYFSTVNEAKKWIVSLPE